MKIKMVSVHLMVDLVKGLYLENQKKEFPSLDIHYTCHIVKHLFGEPAVYAWCKLLEESYPGSVYHFQGDWINAGAGGIAGISFSFHKQYKCHKYYDYVSSTELRMKLFEKLLNQPDRIICWLE